MWLFDSHCLSERHTRCRDTKSEITDFERKVNSITSQIVAVKTFKVTPPKGARSPREREREREYYRHLELKHNSQVLAQKEEQFSPTNRKAVQRQENLNRKSLFIPHWYIITPFRVQIPSHLQNQTRSKLDCSQPQLLNRTLKVINKGEFQVTEKKFTKFKGGRDSWLSRQRAFMQEMP